MRKLLALLFAVAASAPYCAGSSWADWGAVGAASAPVTTTSSYIAAATSSPVSNTKSQFSGFTAVGTTSSSYPGALTDVSSANGWNWGTPTQTAAAVVNSTTVAGVNWASQPSQTVASSGVSTYGGATTSWWGAWGGTVAMMSQPSSLPTAAGMVPGAVTGPSYGANFGDNPEPGTILTFVGGMAAVLMLRRRMMRKSAN
jgi:hypothetical protein